jgi:hypothetical protein
VQSGRHIVTGAKLAVSGLPMTTVDVAAAVAEPRRAATTAIVERDIRAFVVMPRSCRLRRPETEDLAVSRARGSFPERLPGRARLDRTASGAGSVVFAAEHFSYNEIADGTEVLAAIVEPELPGWAASAWEAHAAEKPDPSALPADP